MAQLPANIQNMATGLAASINTVGASGNVLYMKMVEGEFLFGAEETPVEEGSIWAVNPKGFQHGWIAWGDKKHGTNGQMLGEKMGPAEQPMFPEAELEPVEGRWSKAIAISLACTNGEDEGVQCLYKANSHGGRRAYGDLLEQVVERIVDQNPECVPLVELKAGHYKHKEYGKTWYPIFEVVEWRTLDDVSPVESDDEEPEPEPEPEKPRRRRGKTAAAPEPEPAPEEDAPEEEEEAPKPRRRRRRAA